MLAFLALLTSALSVAGLVTLFFLWWPFRKTNAVRCLPWFMAAQVLLWICGRLSEGAVAEKMQMFQSDYASKGELTLYVVTATMVLSALWNFLGWLLLLANAAFVLHRLGFASGVIHGLKRVYDFTVPLGIVYLITTVLCSGLGAIILINILESKVP